MNKIFIATIITITCIGSAIANFKSDPDNSCWLETTGKNEFWFCGTHGNKCAGNKLYKNSKRHWMGHGESFYHDNSTFYCCVDANGNGKFVKSLRWIKSETLTITVEGGTCSYTTKTDACGKVISDEPCTVATTCDRHTVKRNQECVTECPAGQAFASDTSNECIPCETSGYHGIVISKGFKVCKECNPNKEFYNPRQEACVSKDDFIQYSKGTMRQCGLCPNSDMFKECLKIMSMTNPKDATNYDQIRSDCKIK